MVTVVRPGGYVVLNHSPNEAEHRDYGNMHQWNFEERAGRCAIWRPGVEHDLEAAVPEARVVECSTLEYPEGPRVVAVLQKPAG